MTLIKNHKLAIIFAFITGIICIAPHIIFRISLGSDYRGIYLMKTAGEVEYVGRIQEIADGHWTLGSVPFFEYKDKPPLMPPSIFEFSVAGMNRLFKMSIANIVILSKFFLPALLFLLIYFLIRELTENKERLSNKVNAISGGLLIVLGYDLIDYRSILNYSRGLSAPSDFLLWTRPNNPILGALLIFFFLLLVWHLYKKENHKYRYMFLAGLTFAAAVMSYFFSWGIILSLTGLFFIWGLLKTNYKFVKNLIFIVAAGFILALPYFYNVFLSMQDSSYQESAARTGLFLTPQFVLNKFLLFSLFVFFILTFLGKKLATNARFSRTGWWPFSLILILAGFIAFNQQVITGKDIWHFHFVQYTIPLAIAALSVVFYNVISNARTGKEIFYSSWLTAIIFIAAVSLSFGIYTQISAYRQNYSIYKERQKYADIFDWINENTVKDSVILSEDGKFLNLAIPAFTHSNIYSVLTDSFLTPPERIYHNYFTYLRFKDISSREIADYLDKNAFEAAEYLYGTEGLYYGASCPSFVAAKDKIIADYKDFLKKDFESELRQYKLDYIISEKNSPVEMKNLIKNLDLIYSSEDFKIYRF